LGNLGGQSVANDINDNGLVVGYSYTSSGIRHAFKWIGTMTDLDAGKTFESVAEAVNGSGDAAGWATTSGQYRTRYWANGGSSGQNLFGTSNSKALGINGQYIVGVRINSSGEADVGYSWNRLDSNSSWTTGTETFVLSRE